MGERVSRDQLLNCLRRTDWRFKRRGKHVELWRTTGSAQLLQVPFLRSYPVKVIRTVLRDAGLSEAQIEHFLRDCVKE